MVIKLKIPKYLTISKATFLISMCLLTISLVSFFWTLMTSSQVYIDLTSKGWSDFLSYYGSILKLAGVSVALFALWMTAERMKQTQDQIMAIVENNRFNNFFRHREEFIKYLSSQRFMINLAKYSDQNMNDLLLTYHGMYFSKNYENFKPKLEDYNLNHIKEFCIALNGDRDLSYNLAEYILSGRSELSFSKPSEFFLETTRAFRYLIGQENQLKNWFSENPSTRDSLGELCHLYYTYRIYMNVVSFSGEKLSNFIFPQFISNFTSFLNRNGMQILILD